MSLEGNSYHCIVVSKQILTRYSMINSVTFGGVGQRRRTKVVLEPNFRLFDCRKTQEAQKYTYQTPIVIVERRYILRNAKGKVRCSGSEVGTERE